MSATTLSNGRSCRAHMDALMDVTEADIVTVFTAIRSGRKLTPKERNEAWRRLAGVVGKCESIRIWLEMGAPK